MVADWIPESCACQRLRAAGQTTFGRDCEYIFFVDCADTFSTVLIRGNFLAKVAKIVGWSPATMVRMSARYGHFGLEDLRGAVETISRPAEGGIDQRSPVNPPGISESPNAKVN
jgi:hypothetical protein